MVRDKRKSGLVLVNKFSLELLMYYSMSVWPKYFKFSFKTYASSCYSCLNSLNISMNKVYVHTLKKNLKYFSLVTSLPKLDECTWLFAYLITDFLLSFMRKYIFTKNLNIWSVYTISKEV